MYPDRLNFAQATGGLATIEIEGLRGGGGGSGCNTGFAMIPLLLLAAFVFITRKSRKA